MAKSRKKGTHQAKAKPHRPNSQKRVAGKKPSKKPKYPSPEVQKVYEGFALSEGRASAEDIAKALSEAVGGAKGLAHIMKEMIFDSATRPATRAKLIQQVATFFERIDKHLGNERKLSQLSREEIEIKLTRLYEKHKCVPIPGVTIRASSDEQKGKGKAGKARKGHRAIQPNAEPAGDVDAGRLP